MPAPVPESTHAPPAGCTHPIFKRRPRRFWDARADSSPELGHAAAGEQLAGRGQADGASGARDHHRAAG
jgi:hypothetical protein